MKLLKFLAVSLMIVSLWNCNDNLSNQSFSDKVLNPKKGDFRGITINDSYDNVLKKEGTDNLVEKDNQLYLQYKINIEGDTTDNKLEIIYDFDEQGLYAIDAAVFSFNEQRLNNVFKDIIAFFKANYGNPTEENTDVVFWEETISKNGKTPISLSVEKDISAGLIMIYIEALE